MKGAPSGAMKHMEQSYHQSHRNGKAAFSEMPFLIDADNASSAPLFQCNFSFSCRERLIALAELSLESEKNWPLVRPFIPRPVFTSAAAALHCSAAPLFRAISTRCILNEKSRLPLTQSEWGLSFKILFVSKRNVLHSCHWLENF